MGSRDVEAVAQEGDQCGVGASVGGRCGQRDLEGAVVSAGNGILFGSRMNAYWEGTASGRIPQRENHT